MVTHQIKEITVTPGLPAFFSLPTDSSGKKGCPYGEDHTQVMCDFCNLCNAAGDFGENQTLGQNRKTLPACPYALAEVKPENHCVMLIGDVYYLADSETTVHFPGHQYFCTACKCSF